MLHRISASPLAKPRPFAVCKSLLPSSSAPRLQLLQHPCPAGGALGSRGRRGGVGAGQLEPFLVTAWVLHPQKSSLGIVPFSWCLLSSA